MTEKQIIKGLKVWNLITYQKHQGVWGYFLAGEEITKEQFKSLIKNKIIKRIVLDENNCHKTYQYQNIK